MEQQETGISKSAFEEVFKAYFAPLHSYAYTLLQEDAQAEEIVQQVYYKLWLKKNELHINQKLKAYLYKAVHNECLNFIKHQKVKKTHQEFVMHTEKQSSSPIQQLAAQELKTKIQQALASLPEQCRTIFQMSRFEDLKYREIAEQLQLSVKTVENQMGKALRTMRQHLSAYLSLLWALCVLAVLLVK